MFCPKCKTEYENGTAVCPECGSELTDSVPSGMKAEWGLAGQREGTPWPTDANGVREKAVFLAHRTCLNMEDKMLRNMLESYGIPCVSKLPGDGGFSKVVLGMSSNGADIYVPESLLEDARALIGGEGND